MTKLPNFDHSKEWRVRSDRPPRRKVDYSSRQNGKHQLSRTNSLQNGNKKTKADTETEGTDSESQSNDDEDDDDALEVEETPMSRKKLWPEPSRSKQKCTPELICQICQKLKVT